MNRGDITNAQWERLQPLLPSQKPKTGRPAVDHRRSQRHLMDSAHRGTLARSARTLWSLAYRGQPLLPLAEGWYLGSAVGGGASPSRRRRPAELGPALSRWHHDPSPSARGWGKKRDPESEALGRSRGGFSTKVHLRAEGGGQLLTLILTPGQQHEATVFESLLESGAVKRRGAGRPKRRPHRIIGDKGYSSRRIRRYARQHGIRILSRASATKVVQAHLIVLSTVCATA